MVDERQGVVLDVGVLRVDVVLGIAAGVQVVLVVGSGLVLELLELGTELLGLVVLDGVEHLVDAHGSNLDALDTTIVCLGIEYQRGQLRDELNLQQVHGLGSLGTHADAVLQDLLQVGNSLGSLGGSLGGLLVVSVQHLVDECVEAVGQCLVVRGDSLGDVRGRLSLGCLVGGGGNLLHARSVHLLNVGKLNLSLLQVSVQVRLQSNAGGLVDGSHSLVGQQCVQLVQSNVLIGTVSVLDGVVNQGLHVGSGLVAGNVVLHVSNEIVDVGTPLSDVSNVIVDVVQLLLEVDDFTSLAPGQGVVHPVKVVQDVSDRAVTKVRGQLVDGSL